MRKLIPGSNNSSPLNVRAGCTNSLRDMGGRFAYELYVSQNSVICTGIRQKIILRHVPDVGNRAFSESDHVADVKMPFRPPAPDSDIHGLTGYLCAELWAERLARHKIHAAA